MTDYEKLNAICDEIDGLFSKHLCSFTPAFRAWYKKVVVFLNEKYGKESAQLCEFKNIPFPTQCYRNAAAFSFPNFNNYPNYDVNEQICWNDCAQGLREAKLLLETYLNWIEDANKSNAKNYKEVFIVHGHEGELKEQIARLLLKQGIIPIILSEQVNKGDTIIEKLESHKDVGAAICLFTTDDFGRGKKEEKDRTRARQNVVFETGYFLGALGRNYVIIIVDDDIELPSDMNGIVYIKKGNHKLEILKELKGMGFTIDLNLCD